MVSFICVTDALFYVLQFQLWFFIVHWTKWTNITYWFIYKETAQHIIAATVSFLQNNYMLFWRVEKILTSAIITNLKLLYRSERFSPVARRVMGLFESTSTPSSPIPFLSPPLFSLLLPSHSLQGSVPFHFLPSSSPLPSLPLFSPHLSFP